MAQKQSPHKGTLSSEEDDSGMDPLKEIELLRGQLMERDAHIAMIEEDYTKCNVQLSDMERQIMVWREKYDRLYDSHKRVQKINQNLEDKLLQMADKCSIDKSQLARDIEILSLRLAESNHSIGSLQKENERYKNDMNLAIQLLQCKPDHFVSQKFDSFPIETQARVSSYILSKAKNDLTPSPTGKMSATTPEKINHQEFEFNISASLMSKILEESVQNTISKHCDTCTCLKKSLNPFAHRDNKMSVTTQTVHKMETFCPNCSTIPLQSIRPPPVLTPMSPLTPISPPTPCNNLPNEIAEIMEVKNIPEKKIPTNSPSISMKQTPAEPANVLVHHPQHTSPVISGVSNIKPAPRPSEDSSKLISLKHKEIMDKIGDNLNEMNLKHDFKFQSVEPATGHHRLCDRTKHHTFQSGDTECVYPKHEEVKTIDVESCKPVLHSPKLVSTIQMADDIDVSFAQIENTTTVPNTAEVRQQQQQQPNVNIPKSKSDLNYVENPKALHNSSISSNEAESKTSSSRSWKNNGSYSGSNNKVHIGPGPRFCSLRMQAGSKNILLDNAQPNIAPVLYTRTRNFETTPLIDGELTLMDKKESNKLPYHGHINQINANNITRNVYSNTSTNEEIPILDLPNEDLPLSKPIQVCEKPESGYKSNDSAEIIDKLLFGMENSIQDGAKEGALVVDNKAFKNALNEVNEKGALDVNKEKPPPSFKTNIDTSRAETVKQDRREALQNMKVFNFDQYERYSLRIHHTSKMFPPHKMMIPNYGGGRVPGGAQLILPEKKEVEVEDIASPNADNSGLSVEGNKKYVRNIANQTQPEQVPNRESGGGEKSSSSLSSDDSAAVLQKQQLIRVAEWVQKNLEMEHQLEMDNSDSCQQSAEELHHVRNDFPRPAKVDHRTRKASLKAGHKSSHHSSKHAVLPKPEEVVVCEMDKSTEEIEGKVSMVMSHWEADTIGGSTVTNYTTRSYSREELARMEYNVKQFLLNGTRWTSLDSSSKERRTSSKTETDL